MTKPSSDVIVDVPGGLISGWRAGSGEPVLILHGGPGLSDYTTSLADELVDGFTVYRYQQRGLAPSTLDGPFTIETHIADAIAVLDAIDAPQMFLIGHSWGGHLAMHMAAHHPDRLLGLVVVDPLGVVGDGGESDMVRIMMERTTPEAAARSAELDERAMRGEGTPGDAMEALSLVWPAYFARPQEAPPMPQMEMSLVCYSETWESIHRELSRQTLGPLLGRFQAPTVFVLGAESPIPPRHGVASAALIPGARTDILDGCGHFPWLERPGVIRAALDSVRADVLAE
jgi:pimeloyl-ACP methyl ester carboxylesterase